MKNYFLYPFYSLTMTEDFTHYYILYIGVEEFRSSDNTPDRPSIIT